MVSMHNRAWRAVAVSSAQQRDMERIRTEWDVASDEAIAIAKDAIIVGLLGCPPLPVKGMVCSDFIYLRTDKLDKHFFMPTNGCEEHALVFEGDVDMHFAPECTYDVVKMQYAGV